MERLLAKVEVDLDGCWTWTGCGSRGYGQIVEDGCIKKVHRVAYEHLVGPIPEGLTLDHLCRNRACVNPDHLEPVTLRENVLRSPAAPTAVNARKTHCDYGHEFTPENTYNFHGRRKCKACNRERTTLWRRNRRDEFFVMGLTSKGMPRQRRQRSDVRV
jgi:hypothetical protein